MMNTEMANFCGVLGNFPSLRRNHMPSRPARIKTAAGLMVWYCSGSTDHDPTMWPSVLSLAKVAILPAACSKIMVNSTWPTHNGTNAHKWPRSRSETFGERNIVKK